MSKVLILYGSPERARDVAKVSKGKSPQSLVDRMPSPELAAKVGGPPPSPPITPDPVITRRLSVVRRNARD